MSIFISKATINKPVNEVYQFLADMNNHQQLFPENVKDWSSSANEARFRIENMASLAIKILERAENKEIKITAIENPPFALELKWMFSAEDNSTGVILTLSADLSMMMKMLASGPLQKLADHQTKTLTEIFS